MTDRYAAFDKLRIERPADGILKITFDNPETYNSVDQETHTQLTYIWREIDADPTVRSVIVTGEGRAFSAGGDFGLIEKIIEDYKKHLKEIGEDDECDEDDSGDESRSSGEEQSVS